MGTEDEVKKVNTMRETFLEIYDEFCLDIYNFAFRVGGGHAVAEAMIDNIFHRSLAKFEHGEYTGKESLRVWLFKNAVSIEVPRSDQALDTDPYQQFDIETRKVLWFIYTNGMTRQEISTIMELDIEQIETIVASARKKITDKSSKE